MPTEKTPLQRVISHLDRQIGVAKRAGGITTTTLLYAKQFAESLLPEEKSIIDKLKEFGDKIDNLTKKEENGKEEVPSEPDPNGADSDVYPDIESILQVKTLINYG